MKNISFAVCSKRTFSSHLGIYVGYLVWSLKLYFEFVILEPITENCSYNSLTIFALIFNKLETLLKSSVYLNLKIVISKPSERKSFQPWTIAFVPPMSRLECFALLRSPVLPITGFPARLAVYSAALPHAKPVQFLCRNMNESPPPRSIRTRRLLVLRQIPYRNR